MENEENLLHFLFLFEKHGSFSIKRWGVLRASKTLSIDKRTACD